MRSQCRAWLGCARAAGQLSRRTPSGGGGGGRQDRPRRTLLLWATSEPAWREALDVAEQLTGRLAGHLRAIVAVPAALADLAVFGTTLLDTDGNLSAAYGFGDGSPVPAAVLVRPDGYLSYRSSAVDVERLMAHLSATTLRIDA